MCLTYVQYYIYKRRGDRDVVGFFFASSFFCLCFSMYVSVPFVLLTVWSVCMCLCVRVCVCVFVFFFVEFLFCLRLSFSFFFCLFVCFVFLCSIVRVSSYLKFPRLSLVSVLLSSWCISIVFFFFLLFNSVLYQSLNMYRFNSQIGLVAVAKGPLFVCL